MNYKDIKLFVAVIPLLKTLRNKNDIYQYEVPVDLHHTMRVGALVLVPFGKKQVLGVVWEMSTIKQFKSVKPIAEIVLKLFLTLDQIKMVQLWSEQSLLSRATILNYFCPQKPKRKVKLKKNVLPYKPLQLKTKYLEDLKLILNNNQEKIVHYTDYNLIRTVYLKKIEMAYQDDDALILFFPTSQEVLDFSQHIPLAWRNSIYFWTKTPSKAEYWSLWSRILKQELQIVIGTKKAIYLPISPLGSWLIDQPESRFYHNKQHNPRFNFLDLINYRAVNEDLQFFSFFPAARLIKKYGPAATRVNLDSKVTLINLSKTFGKNIFSDDLIANINQSVVKQEAIIILHPEVLNSSWRYCKKCQLSYKIKNKEEKCLTCQTDLISVGLDLQEIANQFKELFPKLKISFDDQDQADVLITSFEVLKKPLIKPALVCLLNADLLFLKPNYSTNWQAFTLLEQLRIWSLNHKLLIQTKNFKHPLWSFFMNQKGFEFAEEQLARRQKMSYPPYGNLIELFSYHQEAELLSKRLYQDLKTKFTTLKLTSPEKITKEKVSGYRLILKAPQPLPLELSTFLKKLDVAWVIKFEI